MIKHKTKRIGFVLLTSLLITALIFALSLPTFAASSTETEITVAKKATASISVDGNANESAWKNAAWESVSKRQQPITLNNSCEFATAWNNTYFYIAVKVTDSKILSGGDTVDVLIDPKNAKASGSKTVKLSYKVGEKKLEGAPAGTLSACASTSGGYIVELAVKFSELGISNPFDGTMLGVEVMNGDIDAKGDGVGILYWNATAAENNPATWGSVCLYINSSPVISTAGTPKIDGTISSNENWDFTSERVNSAANYSYKLASKCDTDNLYIAIEAKGSNLSEAVASIFIDRDNMRGGASEGFIQFVEYSFAKNACSYSRSSDNDTYSYSIDATTASKKTSDGYSAEIRISLSELFIKPAHLDTICMEIEFFQTVGKYDNTRTVWSDLGLTDPATGKAYSLWNSSNNSGTIVLNNVNVAGGSNNAPTGNQITSNSIAKGGKIGGKVTVTDPDGDKLTFKFDPACTNSDSSYGKFTLDASTGAWSFDASGSSRSVPYIANYYVLATDPSGASFHQRIEVRVEPTPTNITYYVNGDKGSDGNDGKSPQKPLRTISAAHNKLKPGDTVIIHEASKPYEGLTISKSGLPEAYITFTAAPGENPVVLTNKGWDTIRITGSYIKFNGITVKGFGQEVQHEYKDRYMCYYYAFDGRYKTVLKLNYIWQIPNVGRYNTNGISITPSDGQGVKELGIDKVKVIHHVELTNCYLDSLTSSGTGASICDYITIKNNTITNNCWGNMYACSGISILGTIDIDDKFDEHKIVVMNNITAGNRHFVPWIDVKRFSDGNGIIIDSTNNISTNKDRIQKGDKWGVQPYQGRILVANNLTYLNGGSGIHVFDGDHVDLINNTVYSNSSTPILGYSDFYASQANDINMYNNIVYSRTGAKMNISASANRNVVYDNNLFYNYSSENNLGKNIQGTMGNMGTTAGSNNIYGKDPMFTKVYEINHNKGIPYPSDWTAEMKSFAEQGGYFVGADYSVTNLDYDFTLKPNSPALGKGNKEWSDKIGNTDNRLGIFGTVGRIVDSDWVNPFNDVSYSSTYYNAVKYVYQNGLFKGVSATEFAPDTTMTRAMFVTVIGRHANVNQSAYPGVKFTDAKAGEWYSAYLNWASESKIVEGYGNGKFGVDDTVTVEQVVTMLARYASHLKINTSSSASLSAFSDAKNVSDWASNAMKWAYETGIYTGNNGKLQPQSEAKRWLLAEMMLKFNEKYGK